MSRDKDGNYAEYGVAAIGQPHLGTFPAGQANHRQNSTVTFSSVFPGIPAGRYTYTSRFTVYPASHCSLPKWPSPKMYPIPVYSTSTGYYTKGTPDAGNKKDHIFYDSLPEEPATVTRNLSDGLVITHLITVAA